MRLPGGGAVKRLRHEVKGHVGGFGGEPTGPAPLVLSTGVLTDVVFIPPVLHAEVHRGVLRGLVLVSKVVVCLF